MASPQGNISLPGSSFFHVCDVEGVPPCPKCKPRAQFGECNFSGAVPGAKDFLDCGCKQFWSRGGASGQQLASLVAAGGGRRPSTSHANPAAVEDELAFMCMCSHHVCYHDPPWRQASQAAPAAAASALNTTVNRGNEGVRSNMGQGNEGGWPSMNRGNEGLRPNMSQRNEGPWPNMNQRNEGLRPPSANGPYAPFLHGMPFQVPPANQANNMGAYNNISYAANPHQNWGVVRNEDIRPLTDSQLPDTLPWGNHPLTDSQLPDTLPWGNHPDPVPGGEGQASPLSSTATRELTLPPPSAPPSSTTSSQRMRQLLPFGGLGANNMAGAWARQQAERRDAMEGGQPLDQGVAVPPVGNPETEDLETVPNTPRSPPRQEEDLETVANTPRSPRQEEDLEPVVNTPRSPRQANHLDTVVNTPRSPRQADGLQTVVNTPRSAKPTEATGRENQARENEAREPQERGIQACPGHEQCPCAQDDLSHAVRDHEDRIGTLENASSVGDHEECANELESHDLRIAALESRTEDLENHIDNDSSSADSGCCGLHGDDDEAAFNVRRMGRLQEKVQDINVRVDQGQGLFYQSRLWEVEVVFLPFALRGVWMEPRELPCKLPSKRKAEPDGWMQLFSHMLDEQLPMYSEWTGPTQDSDWLHPRACGQDSMTYQRLKSRGLVKKVSGRGADWRSIQQVIAAEFEAVMPILSPKDRGSTTHYFGTRFMGLQQPWVPLRKIRKDSRLGFLSPAEMVTPATWNSIHLGSSVIMKTDVPLMFITQPGAYLQDQDAFENGWTWERVKKLPRVSSGSQNSAEALEAEERCWTFTEHLDAHPNRQNDRPHLRRAAQSARKSANAQKPSVGRNAGKGSSQSRSRSRMLSPLVSMKERKTPRPPNIRASSKTPTAARFSESPAQRRLSSVARNSIQPNGPGGRPASQRVRASPSSAYAVMKAQRRRDTRSPSMSLLLGMRNTTPRYSTHSPTPMFEGGWFPKDGSSAGRHQSNPAANYYATPHSNPPPYTMRRGTSPGMEMDLAEEDEGSSSGGGGRDSSSTAMVVDADGGSESESAEETLNLGHPRRVRGEAEAEEEDDEKTPTRPTRPEDQPRPGIETDETWEPEDSGDGADDDMTDVVGSSDDNMSQVSEGPSEYSSREPLPGDADDEDGDGELWDGMGD